MHNRVIVTTTQMMTSIIDNPIPTHAEVMMLKIIFKMIM